MNDIERIRQYINGDNCCISIVTYEEEYALDIVRQAALDLKKSLWIWSVTGGVREGFLSDSLYISDTDTASEGLIHFTDVKENSVCVTLDLAEHLHTGLAMRVASQSHRILSEKRQCARDD